MRNVMIIAAAASLGACATMSPTAGVSSIGPDQYTVSEMGLYGGNVMQRAASFCASKGQQMTIMGNTTQKGLYSGDDYAVLAFRCDNG